jgi:hypothetical protein
MKLSLHTSRAPRALDIAIGDVVCAPMGVCMEAGS